MLFKKGFFTGLIFVIIYTVMAWLTSNKPNYDVAMIILFIGVLHGYLIEILVNFRNEFVKGMNFLIRKK